MTQDSYCSMIHGGLSISSKNDGADLGFKPCCLLGEKKHWYPILDNENIHQDQRLTDLRSLNRSGKWYSECEMFCGALEKNKLISMRQGMNAGLARSQDYDLPGPLRLDLQFDISCNLACRTCGPSASTFWIKHLKDKKQLSNEWPEHQKNSKRIIEILKKLDLSNLQQVVLCGGETLLGSEYWNVADWLAMNVPNAKQNLMMCFQTNGTQSISERWFQTIDKFKLVKLQVSLDGINDRFEYLRWPASWAQVSDNLYNLREKVPSNVMFLIEETVSIFNVLYLNELESWVADNFYANREGDVVDHTRHLAKYSVSMNDSILYDFSLNNASQLLVDAMLSKGCANLIPNNWQENPEKIKSMIETIKYFDQLRDQDFKKTFPEVFECFQHYW